MKAISLFQPWATLCVERHPAAGKSAFNAHGAKPWETRGWKPPESLRGELLAIHAGLSTPRAVRDAICPGGRFVWPFAELLEALGYGERGNPHALRDPTIALPRGVVLGVVRYVRAERTEAIADAMRQARGDRLYSERALEISALGDFTPGRWGWLFAEPVKLREPVACRGRQRIFTLPADVEAAVRAQIPNGIAL